MPTLTFSAPIAEPSTALRTCPSSMREAEGSAGLEPEPPQPAAKITMLTTQARVIRPQAARHMTRPHATTSHGLPLRLITYLIAVERVCDRRQSVCYNQRFLPV